MKPSVTRAGPVLSGRVMQWFSSRPCGTSLPYEEREVAGQLGLADVLGQPDRADRVEPGLGHLAVVQVPDFGQVGQAPFLDRGLRPGRLLRGQRHPERPDAVLARGVHHHAAPAAADVEQPHPWLQRELARDQVELGRLRLLQGRVLRRVAGAGVGHGRAEHPLVEGVGHVVVVRDRARVPLPGVAPARQPAAVDPDLLRRRRDPRHAAPSAPPRLRSSFSRSARLVWPVPARAPSGPAPRTCRPRRPGARRRRRGPARAPPAPAPGTPPRSATSP